MSKCIEKLPCKGCGSSDALQVFKGDKGGEYTGWCFSCNTYYPDPYKDKPEGYTPPSIKGKSEEEIISELSEIETYPILGSPDRKLKEETFKHFGVRTGLSEFDGTTPSFHYFPYEKDGILSSYKVRFLMRKNMWAVGSLSGVDMFGWSQAKQSTGRKIFITEGEYDAMSLYQILRDSARGTKWEDMIPAVCSLPHGSGSAVKTFSKYLPLLESRWEEVIFVPDMDEEGQKAASGVSKLSPKIKIASLPMKDVNECLKAGRSKAVKNAVMFNAVREKNTRIIRGSSLRERSKKRPEVGIDWPWVGMTKATRGIRRKETYYFGAGVKMGKSEVKNALGAHLIVNDHPTFIVAPEEAVTKTYQRLVGKVANRIFHDPNIPFDEEAYDKAEPLVGDKALIQDVYQFAEWDSVRNDIKYVVVAEGVKDIILDPITCFTNRMSAAEANEFLVTMSAELSAMAKDLDFTSYIFCHLKAPEGTPHERGGKVLSHQFAGSRAMMRSCNYMIGIEGNKDPDLSIEERNRRDLVILEDREFGCSDRVHLYWDHKTGAFNEIFV